MATTHSVIFISQPCPLVCSDSMEACAALHGTAGMAGQVVSVRLPAQVYVTNSATSRPAKFETILIKSKKSTQDKQQTYNCFYSYQLIK